ncbi:glycosyltransferase [Rhodococcus sp. IEGM 1401]|uniref:glycosyltransferase n=1 Tax=unclassified Rhodococcus (in: high G+C Gram-positive bacteria) TaxID=192944 RepID=UPI0022B39FA1|nr:MULTISPECIES: glycosyltransferase [unclassified Rhodococcus (in: high G+C Gram-positive bacteria)]MCZ4560898.1 glycosyltransferase [Rhodococcus sp. IEGM 1401]MDI9921039.1 glycosyltransferase [Rhodococcus sp. IEGM 1372]MDV8033361.1 glycosyltransferase [Rhodococcus sp. IEGM 1414]
MAEELGLKTEFIKPDGKTLIERYVRSIFQTRRCLRSGSSASVFLMLPPAPALLTVMAFKRRNTRVVADLHTGYFLDPKWRWFSKIGLWTLRNEAVVVTNAELAKITLNSGVRTFVLHDILSDRSKIGPTSNEGYVLCPLSYANDEPVNEIVAAAGLCPQIRFVLTGRVPENIRRVATPNVRFTGYVTNQVYEDLVLDAQLICALTKRDFTMQRAGYEALMAGKPQVTSNFSVLSQFLSTAAAYVDPNDPQSIAKGVQSVAKNSEYYSGEAKDVLVRRIAEQRQSIDSLRAITTTTQNPQAEVRWRKNLRRNRSPL